VSDSKYKSAYLEIICVSIYMSDKEKEKSSYIIPYIKRWRVEGGGYSKIP